MKNKKLRFEEVHGGLDVAQDLSHNIDREAGLIRNVAIHGPESRNGYNYSEKAQGQVAKLLEGKPVYLDHGTESELRERGGNRSIKDLAGKWENVQFISEARKVRGDIRPIAAMSEHIFDLAESHSENFGTSIVGDGLASRNDDGSIREVLEINAMHSADLVTNPATNDNLWEEGSGDMNINEATRLGDFLRAERERKDMSPEAVARAAGISTSTLSQIERGEIERPPDNRLRGFARALGVSFDRLINLIPENVRDHYEGEYMQTYQEILKSDPDLAQELLAEAKKSLGEGGAEGTKALQVEIKSLREELQANKDEAEKADADKAQAEMVQEAVKESGIDKALLSETFSAILAKANDKASALVLLEDRKAVGQASQVKGCGAAGGNGDPAKVSANFHEALKGTNTGGAVADLSIDTLKF